MMVVGKKSMDCWTYIVRGTSYVVQTLIYMIRQLFTYEEQPNEQTMPSTERPR